MTDTRNPLEVVEEALAEADEELIATFHELSYGRQQEYGPGHVMVLARVQAALALVRKMRADAVVGWVSPVIDDSWFEDLLVCPFRAFAWEAEPDNPRYTRALLLPLPDSPEDDDGD